MSLRVKILNDIKEAMKAKDSKKLEVLRFVNAEIKNKEIALRPKQVVEGDVVQVLKRYLKQRKEAVIQFTKAGRQDLVDKETYEASIITAYLPETLTQEQLKPIVDEVVKSIGASSIKDMGIVMKEVLARVGAQADAKTVSMLVKATLA